MYSNFLVSRRKYNSNWYSFECFVQKTAKHYLHDGGEEVLNFIFNGKKIKIIAPVLVDQPATRDFCTRNPAVSSSSVLRKLDGSCSMKNGRSFMRRVLQISNQHNKLKINY